MKPARIARADNRIIVYGFSGKDADDREMRCTVVIRLLNRTYSGLNIFATERRLYDFLIYTYVTHTVLPQAQ